MVKLTRPQSTIGRALVKLLTAFFVSSIVHYLIDCVALQRLDQFGAFKFWMAQAFVIPLESVFIHSFRNTGIPVPSWAARVTGYCWVLAWFSATVPLWSEPVIRAGFVEDGVHPQAIVNLGMKVRDALGLPPR